MASCSYSFFVGGSYGSSSSNPANATCITIANCKKDVKSHLKYFNCYDSALKTEADLLLARAGKHQTFVIFYHNIRLIYSCYLVIVC